MFHADSSTGRAGLRGPGRLLAGRWRRPAIFWSGGGDKLHHLLRTFVTSLGEGHNAKVWPWPKVEVGHEWQGNNCTDWKPIIGNYKAGPGGAAGAG